METHYIWAVNPVIAKFTIPLLNLDLQLRYYGLLFAASALFAYLLWKWQMKRAGYAEREVDAWFFIGIVCVVLGAHLAHVFFYNWAYFSRHPWEIVLFRGWGMASHGAGVGILLGLAVYSAWFKIPFLEAVDSMAMPTAVGATLVRLGNFFNHEIVGRATNVPWAVRFKYFADHGLYPRHPSQLYEAALGASILAVLFFADRRLGVRRPPGLLAGIFGLLYFTGRFLVEFFKEYHRLDPERSWLTMGQYLSLPFILLAVGLIVYGLWRGPRDPGAWARPEADRIKITVKRV